jgi:hypothetical protein
MDLRTEWHLASGWYRGRLEPGHVRRELSAGDGTQIETDELNMYRIAGNVIHQIEATADNARLTA